MFNIYKGWHVAGIATVVMELAIISLRSETSSEVNSQRDLFSLNGKPSCKEEFVLQLPFLFLTPKQSTLPQPSEDVLELKGKDNKMPYPRLHY